MSQTESTNPRRHGLQPLLTTASAWWRGTLGSAECFVNDLLIKQDIELLYADAFWPVTRMALFAVSLFYAFLLLMQLFVETDVYGPWLVAVAAFSAAILMAMFWLTRSVDKVRLWQVELTDLTIVFVMLANIYAYQFMHLQIDRLNNFVILPVFVAVMGASFRIIIPCLLVSIASLLYFSGQIGADTQSQFFTLTLVITVASPVIHAIVRMIVLREIRARKTAETLRDAARRRADFDGLTGLANRTRFFVELQDRLGRHGARRLALGLVDIDGFKAINDIYGNAFGDSLLIAAAHRLRGSSDEKTLVARMGSDEFGILLEARLDERSLRARFAAKQAAFEEPFVIDGTEIRITISIGVASVTEVSLAPRAISERAEFALFRAKRERRGGLVLFSDKIASEMQNLSAIEHALRNADLVKEMSVEFQPQVEIGSGRVVAFEALARWRNDGLGQVPPDVFIGVAERSGIINRLTLVLLEKALTNAATWPDHIRLSFNLSARDILAPTAVKDICNLVLKSGIAPHRLEFEVTETSVMTDFDEAKRALAKLKALGCTIALDDFGSGYSNFVYIDELDISTLKLDRAFVTRMGQSVRTTKIVKTILDLCQNLQIGSVVEGVEREQDVQALAEIGATVLQGYYFSRPLAAPLVLDYLENSGITES